MYKCPFSGLSHEESKEGTLPFCNLLTDTTKKEVIQPVSLTRKKTKQWIFLRFGKDEHSIKCILRNYYFFSFILNNFHGIAFPISAIQITPPTR